MKLIKKVIRVDAKTSLRIKAKSKELGVSESELIRRAIEQYLGIEVNVPTWGGRRPYN